MNLEQCLEKLSSKAQKRLKENYNLKNNNTLEDLSLEIISSLLEEFFILTDEEMDTLKLGTKRKKVSHYLIKRGYVYLENNQYIIPKEINLVIKELEKKELLDNRLLLVITFYLSAIGALKIVDLVKLMRESGIYITKEKIEFLIKNDAIIKDNIIYFNDIALELDKQIHFVEKISGNYKVFNLKEMINLFYLKEKYFPLKIARVLEKKIKDEERRNFFSLNMVETAMIGIMDEDEIMKSITKEEVKLSLNEREEILDILEEVTNILPTWLDGGFSFFEDIDYQKERQEKIENYCKARRRDLVMEMMDDLYRYILVYVTINGVIELDKLVEILQIDHGLDITRENILTIIKNDDYIKVVKNYLNIMDNDLDTIEELMKIKDNFSNYKIIEDAELALAEFDFHYEKIGTILKQYGIDGEACDTILSLLLIRELSQEELRMILGCFSISFSNKLVNDILKKLQKERREMPTWEKNGFKARELME